MPAASFAVTDDPFQLLVVDDDPDDVELLRIALDRVPGRPYRLESASTEGEGLRIIQEARHDAYLVDYRLGSTLGTELVAAARAEGCRAPLIMLTGYRDRTIDLAAMEAGADDFLVKGQSDAEAIDRTLRYAIRQARTAQILHRNREQVWALDRLSDLLVEHGPTVDALREGVRVIAAAYDRDHVSIFTAEVDRFVLAAQVGYADAVTAVDRSTGMLQHITRSGQPRFIPNLTADPGVRTEDVPRSELCIPITVDKEVCGLLLVGSPTEDELGEFEHGVLVAIAQRIGLALRLDADSRELAARARWIKLATEFATTVAEARIDPVAELLALAPAATAAIGSFATSGSELTLRADRGPEVDWAALASRAVSEGRLVTSRTGPTGTTDIAAPIAGTDGLLFLARHDKALSRVDRDGYTLLVAQLAMALRSGAGQAESLEDRVPGMVSQRRAALPAGADAIAVTLVEIPDGDAVTVAFGSDADVVRVGPSCWVAIVDAADVDAATARVRDALARFDGPWAAGCAIADTSSLDAKGLVANAEAAVELARRAGGGVVFA